MKTILLAASVCGLAAAQSATIVNSGSTNTAGYEIAVPQTGPASYTVKAKGTAQGQRAAKANAKTVPQSLVDALYADLKAASPLSSLPAKHCMKSASFGTRLTVEYGGETSPDLSCGDGGDAKLQALIRDVNAIVKVIRAE